MAQKLILIEASLHEDILESAPISGAISAGYEVTAVNGFSTQDNKPMCFVLLSATAADPTDDETDEDQDSESGEQTTN